MLMLLSRPQKHYKQSEPKILRLRLGQAAICSGLPILADQAHFANMGTKSRDYIYGSTAQQVKPGRKIYPAPCKKCRGKGRITQPAD